MANKIGSKKETCEKYRNSGHKEEKVLLSLFWLLSYFCYVAFIFIILKIIYK